jgi:hypothetical protein
MWIIVMVLTLFASPALAATLTWDRNTEPDMRDYQVWACFTPSCVVVKSPSMLQTGTVLQPATGNPTYVIDLTNREGSIAVSARDQTLNESGLSVAVPFDQRPPVNPVNPRFQ